MLERHGRLSSSLLLITAATTIAGCGPTREPETDGTIALVSGKLQHIAATDEATKSSVCAENFCEPNYVYTANFGRSRPSPPARPPVPAPSPTRTPGTPPPQPYEQLDYSREVLRVPDAWNYGVGSTDIIVAVVDTGVDYTHPDLRNNVWRNEREANGRPGVDDDGNGYVDDVYGWDFVRNRANADDDNRHGTHCAGIIGAERNGIGVVGINQRVRIMPLKFLSASGSGDTMSAIRAIDYAVANGARVISNSWGGGGYSSLLNEAIQRAISRGIHVVAAAGNESNDNDSRATYPANYPGVLSVASTDQSDGLSYFSNYGPKSTFIAAPGSGILSTVPGGFYESLSGTSMAAPQVSGAIAVALSVNPEATMSQIRSTLCGSARKILTSRAGCGRMDVAEFVRSVATL